MIDNLKQFGMKLDRIGKGFIKDVKVPFEVNKVLIKGGNDIVNTAKRSMQKTPKGGITVKRGKERHAISKPGNPPAIDSGRGIASIRSDTRAMRMQAGTDLDYMAIHEKRKKVKFRRPWLEPAVRKNRSNILKALGRIVPDISGKILIEGGAKKP